MNKVPVVKHPWFTLYYEDVKGATFIHCDVHKWNKRTQKALKEVFNTLLFLHNEPIFALHEKHLGIKHLKFLKMYGFEFMESIDSDNKIYVRVK
jgi:hypothetical protein